MTPLPLNRTDTFFNAPFPSSEKINEICEEYNFQWKYGGIYDNKWAEYMKEIFTSRFDKDVVQSVAINLNIQAAKHAIEYKNAGICNMQDFYELFGFLISYVAFQLNFSLEDYLEIKHDYFKLIDIYWNRIGLWQM